MAWDAPAVTTKADADMSSAGGTFSFAHDSGQTGNRFLLFGMAWRSSSAITILGVTYNSVAMTQFGGVVNSAAIRAHLFGLVGPASGSNTLEVSYSTGGVNATYVAGAATYYGVDQAAPYSNYTMSRDTSSASPRFSVGTVTSISTALGVAFHCCNTNSTASPGNAQTERYDIRRTNAGTAAASLSDATGAADTVFHDTWSVDAATNWIAFGASLNVATASLLTCPLIGAGDLVGPGNLLGPAALVY